MQQSRVMAGAGETRYLNCARRAFELTTIITTDARCQATPPAKRLDATTMGRIILFLLRRASRADLMVSSLSRTPLHQICFMCVQSDGEILIT